jgi:hypothetical protein
MHPGVWYVASWTQTNTNGLGAYVLERVGKRGKPLAHGPGNNYVIIDTPGRLIDLLTATLHAIDQDQADAKAGSKVTRGRLFLVSHRRYVSCRDSCQWWCESLHTEVRHVAVRSTSHQKARNVAKRHWRLERPGSAMWSIDEDGLHGDTPNPARDEEPPVLLPDVLKRQGAPLTAGSVPRKKKRRRQRLNTERCSQCSRLTVDCYCNG